MQLFPQDKEMAVEECSEFVNELRQGKVLGSFEVAYQTVKYLRLIINTSDWKTAGDLIGLLSKEGKVLISAQSTETSVGNMVRRVLKIIREEYHSSGRDKVDDVDTHESLQKLLLADATNENFCQMKPNFKDSILDAISDLLSELETSGDIIASNALEHIHANEIIITAGRSKLVEKFFKSAAKERKFQVIVAESAPFYDGHELAKSLTESHIETTVISDAAIFAMMSRCNKVIIGTRAVMANGGLKAVLGTHTLALAAKHYSVPIIVCAPMYKLSPQYLNSYDQDAFNKLTTPHKVLPYSEGEVIGKVRLACPLYDYVPPELVTLYVTNIGGNAPPYVYRLLADLYHPDDRDLDLN